MKKYQLQLVLQDICDVIENTLLRFEGEELPNGCLVEDDLITISSLKTRIYNELR